jgi:aminopeptidase N
MLSRPALFFSAALMLLSGCGDPPSPQVELGATPMPAPITALPRAGTAVARDAGPGLDQAYARFRATQVHDPAYALSLIVAEDATSFSGEVAIRFSLAPGNKAPLTLDFAGGKVLAVTLNDAPSDYDYNDWFITLPAANLREGDNLLQIRFERPYASDGAGLHHFRDPQDQAEYLYTNFEPYAANRWFPLFDQPDLKAPLTLDVIAPASWQVIANTREERIEGTGGSRHWFFPATPPLATYVYAMHAGPWHMWESTAGDIPLRLFARAALAPYVVPEEWFGPTRASFDFYQRYFEVPYPFGKYDQIVVPDFNAGAMENVGAVTFNERYVSRGAKSEQQRRSLASTIAHEMAHMWFGDLVTMQWWNGIWLNESFATFMANLALEASGEFDNVWDTFYTGNKLSAYAADALVTTHPIELEVPSTNDALANFDGITYGKGGAVLKQLPYLIGAENFRSGISRYLQQHAYGNTTLDDFVDALSIAGGTDLRQWQQEWLYQSGTNTVSVDFNCENDNILSLRVLQLPPQLAGAHQVLRTQRTQLGLYRQVDGAMVRASTLPVTYSGEITDVPEASGLPCPDLVLPNEDDWAYMKIALDARSRATLREHINAFENPTTRLMLWQAQWDDVQDGNQSLNAFLDFALANLGAERDATVLRSGVALLGATFNYYARFGGHAEERARIESFMLDNLRAAMPGSELQRIWYDAFVARAHTPDGLELVRNLLTGADSISGFEIDQDRRWDLVQALNRYAHRDYAVLLDTEAARDNSDRGANLALAARAVRPDAAVKDEWLSLLVDMPESHRLATWRYVMASLFPPEQSALLEPLRERILAAVPVFNMSADQEFLGAFTDYMSGATCTPEGVARLAQANRDFTTLQPLVVKAYLVHHQDDERCVQMKAGLASD